MAKEVEVRIIKSITIDSDTLKMYLSDESEVKNMLDVFHQLSKPDELSLSSLPSIASANSFPSDKEKLRNLLICIAEESSDDEELVEIDILPE